MAIYSQSIGFVFKRKEKGEADVLFKVYTKDFGKIEILAKGFRKISSKLRYQIDLFTVCEIVFVEGKNKILIDTKIVKEFKNLRKNLTSLLLAFKICEIFDKLVVGEVPERKIWILLFQSFKYINTFYLDKKRLNLIYQYFIWNLLSYLGYKPQLKSCIFCQNLPKKGNLYFSTEGGIVCQKCKIKFNNLFSLGFSEFKILKGVLKSPLREILKIPVSFSTLKNLNKMAKEFLKKILAKQ